MKSRKKQKEEQQKRIHFGPGHPIVHGDCLEAGWMQRGRARATGLDSGASGRTLHAALVSQGLRTIHMAVGQQ